MAIIKYYWSLFWQALRKASKVCLFISGSLTLFGRIIGRYHPEWGNTMNDLLWIIPMGLFLLILIFSSIKTGTKKAILIFLKSINPEMFEEIDITKETDIHIQIGPMKERELSELASRPDFDKFLSCKHGPDMGDTNSYRLIVDKHILAANNDSYGKADYLIHLNPPLVK